MKPPPDPNYRHSFPATVISHAVWLYHVFSLSLRDVELLLAERSIVVSAATAYRAIRFDAFNDWRRETCARP
jgi:putative transposase